MITPMEVDKHESQPYSLSSAATYDNRNHNNHQESHSQDDVDTQCQRPMNVARRFTLRGPRKDQGSIQNPVAYSSFLCGLIAGVSQAAVFNPYDRALYLSVKERRSFLALQNWKNPYLGLFQSLGGRALSGGLYFPLEHACLRITDPLESSPLRNFVAGTVAGAANALMLNPLSAIKYKTWGREVNRGMLHTAQRMAEKSGSMRPFFNGIRPTVYRDVVFGGCYTWLRLQIQVWSELPPEHQWQANCFAAAMATVASGPFNYARNMQYSTPTRQHALSTWSVLCELWTETLQQSTRLEQIRFMANRLRIGWGTARVALGISFGHAVYDWLSMRTQRIVE